MESTRQQQHNSQRFILTHSDYFGSVICWKGLKTLTSSVLPQTNKVLIVIREQQSVQHC